MTNSITRHLLLISCILCFLPAMLLLFAASFYSLVYLLIIVIPSLFITVYAVIYIKKRLIEPLHHLTNEANRLSAGNFSQPIFYPKNDEIGQFVSAFDQMRTRLYEQQLEQQQFEIERKNFVNSISHDLRTPIASIAAYIEALQDGLAVSEEEEQQYLKVVENKLNVLTELSKQLELSYVETGNLSIAITPVNCHNWVATLFSTTVSECQIRGIQLDLVELPILEDDSIIEIDNYQLDRAIQNILNNAYRYTKSLLLLSAEIKENEFQLSISNDGVTIGEKEIERIFERFYTESGANDQGHLGLGLSISKTIIQSMNGSICAELTSGIITFKLSFPLANHQEKKEGVYTE